MEELLPILSAHLPESEEFVGCLAAALQEASVLLPLDAPPSSNLVHALDVYGPGVETPVALLAQPEGEACAGLYLLRLRPFDAAAAALIRDLLRAGNPSSPSLRAPATGLEGRLLAGGKFEIASIIGTGVMGTVFRGRHTSLRKPVAIKVLHRSFSEQPRVKAQFASEALAASQLEHPNVCQVIDFGEEPDGLLYIVMQLLVGRGLHEILDAERRLPLERTVDLMSQICSALSAAHEVGIVHRDVKPENVVVVSSRDDEDAPSELVKVCDFGLAMQTEQAARAAGAGGPALAALGGLCGTPGYMAPEILRAQPLDARADVYACGVMLYEMATGVLPFSDPDMMALLAKQARDRPVSPREIDPGIDARLEAIILRALSPEPLRRQTARQLRKELRSLVSTDRPRPARTLRPPITNLPPPPELATSGPVPATPGSTPGQIAPEPQPAQASAPSVGRREAAPLADPTVGFSALVELMCESLRTKRLQSGFVQRLATEVDRVVRGRGEVTFIRVRTQEREAIEIATGTGEVLPLARVVPAELAAALEDSLLETFAARGLVSLTLKEGITQGEVGETMVLLARVSAHEQLRAELLAAGLRHVSAVFDDELLGIARGLPRAVVLCISRLARDLRALEMGPPGDPRMARRLRAQIVADAVRPLVDPRVIALLLANLDLISAALESSPGFAGLEAGAAVVGALPHSLCVQAAWVLLADIGKGAGPLAPGERPRAAGAAAKLLELVGRRLARERTLASDDVLRKLVQHAIMSPSDVPEDVRTWVLAERQAIALVRDPKRALAALDATDPASYGDEVKLLQHTARLLVHHGKLVTFGRLLALLDEHARSTHPGDAARAGVASGAVADLAESEIVDQLAASVRNDADDDVVVAASTALRVLRPSLARSAVGERAARSGAPLRGRLEQFVRSSSSAWR